VDVKLERVIPDVSIVAPAGLNQLVTRHDRVGTAHQQLKKDKFFLCKVELISISQQSTLVSVQRAVPDP
jgi:hypothetical protein